jgi:ElaB/YqjD/DUF883 family membrane-anchored ribosome-binding protein
MSENTRTDFGGASGSGATSTESDRIAATARKIGSSAGVAAGTATGLAQTAQEYGDRISEAATQAKDYVTDKVSVVGDKIKDLQNADLGEITENAKDFARKKPGQAILISAAAGLLLGLIIRGRR